MSKKTALIDFISHPQYEEKVSDIYINPWKLSGRQCSTAGCKYPVYDEEKYCWYCEKKRKGLFG